MPELNSLDDFFRRKEQEASVNNDNMPAHWDQMNELLKAPLASTTAVSRSIVTRKFMLYAAALIILILSGLFLFVTNKKTAYPKHQPVATANDNKQIPVTSVHSNTNSLPKSVVSQSRNTSGNVVVKKGNKVTKTRSEKTYITKQEKIAVEIVTTTTTIKEENKIDNVKLFKTFFKELEKPAQEFVINISKDTIITSKEGTQLIIPANAFLNESGQAIRGTIKIYLQEFYSFSDIIGNKLTTMSNDRPLATGGMFNIIAKAEGQNVKINPQQPLTLDIPTKSFDPFMQLFTGQQAPVAVVDTVAKELRIINNGVNWTASGQSQYSMINTTNKKITILNLRDNPYDVFYGRKVIGRFEIPYDSKLSKEETKAELEKRYSKWYDVIKVKRQWGPWRKKNRVPTKGDWYDSEKVGDSIIVSLRTATKLRMITKEDSLAYEAEFKRQYDLAVKQEIARSEWLEIKDKYSFTITDLGWINCDRFLNYPNRKITDFVLNPGAEFSESYLYSVLIFSGANSIMPGLWVNGKIVFQRIPVNEFVSIVSIGIKDGKTWACVQPMYVQKEEVNKMLFEETSPEQLKRKLERFGNVSQVN